jgi:hypothetical protein
MSQTTTIPITVTPEAATRVAELGMQKQLDQMVQHTLETVSRLLSIEVILAPPYDTGDTPRVILEAHRSGPLPPEDRTHWEWIAWAVATFPPQVCEHFVMMTDHEDP